MIKGRRRSICLNLLIALAIVANMPCCYLATLEEVESQEFSVSIDPKMTVSYKNLSVHLDRILAINTMILDDKNEPEKDSYPIGTPATNFFKFEKSLNLAVPITSYLANSVPKDVKWKRLYN